MVGKDKAALVATTPPDPSHGHPAGGEGRRDRAKPFHPGTAVGRRRRQDQPSFGRAGVVADGSSRYHRDAVLPIDLGEGGDGAMQLERVPIPPMPQELTAIIEEMK